MIPHSTKNFARNVRMARAILDGHRLKDVAAKFNIVSHSSIMSGVRGILKGMVNDLPAERQAEGQRMFNMCETSSENLFRERKFWSPLLAAVEEEWLNPTPKPMTKLKVYVAGPNVFEAAADVFFRYAKRVLEEAGFEALIPFEESKGDAMELLTSEQIYDANIKKIRDADAVIANLTPFRGVEPDSGTVFEIGYAKALNLPIVTYSQVTKTVLVRTTEYFQRLGHFPHAHSTQVVGGHTVFADGMKAEDFHHLYNLMLHHSTVHVIGGLKKAVAELKQLTAKLSKPVDHLSVLNLNGTKEESTKAWSEAFPKTR